MAKSSEQKCSPRSNAAERNRGAAVRSTASGVIPNSVASVAGVPSSRSASTSRRASGVSATFIPSASQRASASE